jgi:hypothetical protein
MIWRWIKIKITSINDFRDDRIEIKRGYDIKLIEGRENENNLVKI